MKVEGSAYNADKNAVSIVHKFESVHSSLGLQSTTIQLTKDKQEDMSDSREWSDRSDEKCNFGG